MLSARIDAKAKKLIVEIDLENKPAPSKSGKSISIATSHGNQLTTAEYNGKPVTVGINAYIRA